MKIEARKNEEKNGIEIVFGSKPSQECRDSMKHYGFQWHGKNGYWYTGFTDRCWEFATGIANSPESVDNIVPVLPPIIANSFSSTLDNLLEKAEEAGREALLKKDLELRKAGPQWLVTQHESPLDDSSPIKSVHGTMLDLCGFVWLWGGYKENVKLVNFIKKRGKRLTDSSQYWTYGKWALQKAYQSGFNVYCHLTGRQEISLKEEMYGAVASVLNEAGFDFYVNSRLD